MRWPHPPKSEVFTDAADRRAMWRIAVVVVAVIVVWFVIAGVLP